MTAIKAYELTKRYRDLTAVSHLSLEIEEGELFALLGINGAGKSTTIKMLTCLTSPSEGDATVFEHSIVKDAPRVKELIAVSPQETAIAPGLSVRENLELICGLYGFRSQERARRVDELIARFSLGEIERKCAGKLSGGWQRRLSIAMALIGEPRVLFLDEPTLGLDVIARAELWDIIRSLKGRTTVILTTHYMEEAEALADRVGIMKDGVLLDTDTPAAFKQRTGSERFEDAFIKIVKEGR